MPKHPVDVATALARDAGKLIRDASGRHRTVERKSAVDLVTEIDRAAEEIIVSGLRSAFPDHDIVAEESAPKPARGANACWYVDPLDGTTNFVHGLPHCAVSMAMASPGGEISVAVVFDPFKNELFTATRRGGARLNGKAIRVSAASTLDESLFVTGFPYDRRQHTKFYISYFETFIRRCRDVRRFGSASLDLCYVASGRFDGFWEWRLKPWDTAAGWLIVEEAGGRVTDFDGSPYDPWLPRILATNGVVHGEALAVLAELPSSPD
jgi:myo-inositol-1(or 4)-monophosphatase